MPTKTDLPVAEPGPQTWGEVHANQRVMRYRHSGAGPAVMLLGADVAGHSSDLWPELPGLLQAHFRVVIPQLPHNIDDVALSLQCLLDGVGASGIGLIAGGPYCYPATELALGPNGSEYISRLILVGDNNTGEHPTDFASSDALSVPLLVLSRRMSVAKAMSAALPFLKAIVKR